MHIFNDPSLRVQKKIPIEPVIGDCYILNGEAILKENVYKILIVDVETTGLRHDQDEVIEIAGVMAYVDKSTGIIHSIDLAFDYFREPQNNSISAEITEITGIVWEDVVGKVPDLDVIYKAFETADLIVAHNASFDRPFVERLCVELLHMNKPWACSCNDQNWKLLGHKKKGLEALLHDKGFWYDAHLAINDCIAVAYLLSMYPEVVLALIARGSADSYRLSLTRTPYGYNEGVKANGFRWQGHTKCWIQDFGSMDDVIASRAKVQAIFGTSFSGVTMRLDTISPLTRFSAST